MSYARDTALFAGKYLGGIHGPDDMSFSDIYSAHLDANDRFVKKTDNWMASSPYASGDLYHFTRGATYTGMDFASGFLFPFGQMKTAASAGKAILKAEKIAHSSPTLLKTGLVTGKIFKTNVTHLSKSGWILPPKGGGAMINGRWYTEHALERMASRTPQVMAELERRFIKRAKVASQNLPRSEFRKWYRENAPNPRGIPPSVVQAEIAQPGSTNVRVFLNEKGHVKTIIPGGS